VIFQQFTFALEDKPIEITTENFTDLSQLCNEFGCQTLAAQLSFFLSGVPRVHLSAGGKRIIIRNFASLSNGF
jgi:hypothetical protein